MLRAITRFLFFLSLKPKFIYPEGNSKKPTDIDLPLFSRNIRQRDKRGRGMVVRQIVRQVIPRVGSYQRIGLRIVVIEHRQHRNAVLLACKEIQQRMVDATQPAGSHQHDRIALLLDVINRKRLEIIRDHQAARSFQQHIFITLLQTVCRRRNNRHIQFSPVALGRHVRRAGIREDIGAGQPLAVFLREGNPL